MSRRCRPRAPRRRQGDWRRGAQIGGDFHQGAFGIFELQVDLLARIEQRGADRDIIAQQRLHGESIEAAL